MIESTMRPRGEWGPGPWSDEPDRIYWEDRGYPCLIRRSGGSGILCGYVAVPPGHPWHGNDYDSVNADVHGGLTYARACNGNPEQGICHVPKPGESDDVWWLGFDCAHLGDLMPDCRIMEGDTYRTVEYVKEQIKGLVDQAIEAGKEKTS